MKNTLNKEQINVTKKVLTAVLPKAAADAIIRTVQKLLGTKVSNIAKAPYKGSKKAHLAAKKAWVTIKAKKNARK
jgi:hypothetical protein